MAKGVETHGKKLRLYFRWRGEKCREPLDLAPTPENIAHAERLVALIEHDIRAGTFDYGHYFPRSPRLEENTFGHYLSLWLEIKKGEVAESTFRAYHAYAAHRIRPRWGGIQADRIDYLDLQRWVRADLDGLSNKSIKEIVAILRQVFRLFRTRNPSASDPTENLHIRVKDHDEPDPFTRAEIAAILETPTVRVQELNLIRFMLWAGPRVSEAIALAWEDVDLKAGTVKIRRAKVDRGSYKVTKTRGSARTIELLDDAREALERQWAITGHLPPVAVDIRQRDNRSIKREPLRFVFHRTGTTNPVPGDKALRDRFFKGHLAAAGVRYRGPSQCRHTFASQMLTINMPIAWILSQTGHTSEGVFRRSYARWLPGDATTDMRSLARQRLNGNP